MEAISRELLLELQLGAERLRRLEAELAFARLQHEAVVSKVRAAYQITDGDSVELATGAIRRVPERGTVDG